MMAKLKLGPLVEDKPVRVAIDLPADLHRDLLTYAAAHAVATTQPQVAPEKLIAPMLRYFLANDRGFIKARREARSSANGK
ncbi:MAG: hypothetical protein JWR80_572 [Bradyrhizobium sp.]|nr:hypothetical protein [Bradyrhizobium sp.]